MQKDVNSTSPYSDKWYKSSSFPLVPILTIKKADRYNAKGFTFKWLFFTIWTLENITFEISIVCEDHWGFGIIGILPYLRWACTVPIPNKLSKLLRHLSRTPKLY